MGNCAAKVAKFAGRMSRGHLHGGGGWAGKNNQGSKRMVTGKDQKGNAIVGVKLRSKKERIWKS